MPCAHTAVCCHKVPKLTVNRRVRGGAKLTRHARNALPDVADKAWAASGQP